jgi:hypothetical protein
MPSSVKQQELCSLFLKNTKIESTKRKILEFLSEASAQTAPEPMEAVRQEPILQYLGWPVDDPHRAKLRKTISSLKKDLELFFSKKDEGRKASHRIEIADYTHILSFPANVVDLSGQLIKMFWDSYIRSNLRNCLYYPEPQFFRDSHYTYLRNPEVNSEAGISHFSYLKVKGALKPSYSYVPSGLVVAMARLLEFFARQQTEITAAGLGPYENFQDDHEENRIFLGTPGTSLSMISNVGASLPLQTVRERHANAVVVHEENGKFRKYRDRTRADGVREKHVVVSRRFRLSSCTTCVAGHSRAVQGVVENFTRSAGVSEFAKRFARPEQMKSDFQALFRVEMSESQGQLTILNVQLERAVDQEELASYKARQRSRPA